MSIPDAFQRVIMDIPLSDCAKKSSSVSSSRVAPVVLVSASLGLWDFAFRTALATIGRMNRLIVCIGAFILFSRHSKRDYCGGQDGKRAGQTNAGSTVEAGSSPIEFRS
jgi:hypothetical protein